MHLARFNQELNLAVSKILTNQANHAHRTDRLRQNAQLLEAIRTKLAEKKLEQLNDELMYAKQKQLLQQHTLSIPAPSFVHLPNGELVLGMDGIGVDGDAYLQLKQMRAFKQASLRKIIEELGDQMKLAKLMKEIEEDRQALEDQQIQLEIIEVVSSIAVRFTTKSFPTVAPNIKSGKNQKSPGIQASGKNPTVGCKSSRKEEK